MQWMGCPDAFLALFEQGVNVVICSLIRKPGVESGVFFVGAVANAIGEILVNERVLQVIIKDLELPSALEAPRFIERLACKLFVHVIEGLIPLRQCCPRGKPGAFRVAFKRGVLVNGDLIAPRAAEIPAPLAAQEEFFARRIVPVGEKTLGRMFNVLGEAIDKKGDVDAEDLQDQQKIYDHELEFELGNHEE